jgi:ABC-2 type transport system ATP-binding protein
MTGEPIVEIKTLTKKFDTVTALNELSLEIHPGRIVGLVGANGGGKSTLLRHIVGLYLPDQGSCLTLGREAARLSPAELGRIGYVHQEGELIDWMTVPQLIRYVAAYYPTWNGELEHQFIARFELPLEPRVGTLSPGQRQKLAILLAIGFEPGLLILDEPAAALDPLARHEFLELLLDIIQDAGRTIIISSHILSDVEKVIDHVLILDKGKILRDCAFDELQEEFLKVRLSSLNGPLPTELPFNDVVACEQTPRQAVVTMKRVPGKPLDATAHELNCSIDVVPISFEEVYGIVVRHARGTEV